MANTGEQLLANIFKALAHGVRLQIIRLLQEKPLCVCEILPRIASEQSNTSQHLAVLRNQGIVESRKEGLMVIYQIKSPEVYQMLELAEQIILRQLEETKKSLTPDN